MSLTSNKKKEIIQNLGKYRNTSDTTIKEFVNFTQELVLGLNTLVNDANDLEKINPADMVALMNRVTPTLNRALNGATEYYDSLSKYYVTALNEIAELKTEKNNG